MTELKTMLTELNIKYEQANLEIQEIIADIDEANAKLRTQFEEMDNLHTKTLNIINQI